MTLNAETVKVFKNDKGCNMRISSIFVCLALIASSPVTWADWHAGTIKQLNVGYDGATISFILDGWTRTDCTCYSTWPGMMCLDKAREAHDFEKSLLLTARARGSVIHANIDESTCKVTAIYEIN